MTFNESLSKFATSVPSIASYDYTDLSSGLGYQTFYLFNTYSGLTASGNPSISYHISDFDITALANMGDTTGQDFDSSTFNVARTIRGNAILTGESGSATAAYYKIELYRVDASSGEHVIAASYRSQASGAANQPFTIIVPCTETTIKVGEKLRATISVSDAGGSISATAGLTLRMPFKIDV